MKKVILVVALAALLAPLAALADDSPAPAPTQTANQMCAADKAKLGDDTFKQTYGTNANKANAWGKCVSGKAKTAGAAVQDAVQQCTTEQAQDATAFTGKYGKGAGKNALRKCISAKVHDEATTQAQKALKAAKACKGLRKSDAAGFATKYGAKANAFGKCVAAKGK